MGPLALMAYDAYFGVCGSDLAMGAVYDELVGVGIDVKIGPQDGEFLRQKIKEGKVDWFVYTSALPEDHAELKIAREAGIKCTKRDDFTAFLVDKLDLKMVAVAGTHGKTTTAAMIVWLAKMLGLPVSHVVGTTLEFAPSGVYFDWGKYFIYEADEYDRNFLKFHPWLSVITCISYDHPDIYKKERDYRSAFRQFKAQSEQVLDAKIAEDEAEIGLTLAGKARRYDARLALGAMLMILRDMLMKGQIFDLPDFNEMVEILNEFPGAGRRFERIADGVYTDYAHHPEEIAATMEMAKEEAERLDKKGVVVVYEPHQNTRQHKIRDEYTDAFEGAKKVYWLPTYLTREDTKLEVLGPKDLIAGLKNKEVAEPAKLDKKLENALQKYIDEDYLVLLMTAGPADAWLKEKFLDLSMLGNPFWDGDPLDELFYGPMFY